MFWIFAFADNAPVTKGVVLACGLASVLVGTQGVARAISLSYQVYCLVLLMELITWWSLLKQIPRFCNLVFWWRGLTMFWQRVTVIVSVRVRWLVPCLDWSLYFGLDLWGRRKLYKTYNSGDCCRHHVCFRQHRSFCLDFTLSTFSEYSKDRLGQINTWYSFFYSSGVSLAFACRMMYAANVNQFTFHTLSWFADRTIENAVQSSPWSKSVILLHKITEGSGLGSSFCYFPQQSRQFLR